MSSKMLPGSILKNVSDLTQGSVQDQIIDRSMMILSNDKAKWHGDILEALADIKIEMQVNEGGSFVVNSLPAGDYDLSSSTALLIVRLNRASSGALIVGSYPDLNSGEYAIIDESTLNANDLNRKDHLILFRRTDFGGSKFLHIPLHKETITQGFTYFPVTNPPDIYVADLHDPLSTTLPTNNPVVDNVTVVNGTRVLFSALTVDKNQVYEASNVGPTTVWTALPLFGPGSLNPSDSDVIKILSGAFYSGQIGIFDLSQPLWSFNDNIRHFNATGDYWEQSSIRYEEIIQSSTNEVFRVASLNSENIFVNYAIKRNGTKRTGQLMITNNTITADIADTNAYLLDVGVEFTAAISGPDIVLSYTADGSNPNGSMRYWVSRMSDQAGGPSGIPQYEPYTTVPIGNLQTAFAMSDGSGIEINCAPPYNVLGKTRLDLSFPFTMNVNPGTTGGQLEVIVDGLVLPRFVAGVTLDAFYKEIDTDTIEFHTDFMPTAISLEVRIRQGTIDTSTANGYKLASYWDAVVGSVADVATGAATHALISSAITVAPAGGKILILNSYVGVESVLVNKKLLIFGQGQGTVITGNWTFSNTSVQSIAKYLMITGNITFDASAVDNVMNDCWQTEASTVTDSGTDNTYYVTGV
jgi:hypothetical protein